MQKTSLVGCPSGGVSLWWGVPLVGRPSGGVPLPSSFQFRIDQKGYLVGCPSPVGCPSSGVSLWWGVEQKVRQDRDPQQDRVLLRTPVLNKPKKVKAKGCCCATIRTEAPLRSATLRSQLSRPCSAADSCAKQNGTNVKAAGCCCATIHTEALLCAPRFATWRGNAQPHESQREIASGRSATQCNLDTQILHNAC